MLYVSRVCFRAAVLRDSGRSFLNRNFAYNTELFDRIIASGYNGDRTGMIGVMQQDNRVKDHVYTFVNNIQIVDSNGSGGVMAMGNLIYKSRTVYYLVPKLPNYKRTK